MYCARYLHAGVLELQDKMEFHFSTDAGSINRLPLQDTCIGAANLVVMACPNVIQTNGAKELTLVFINSYTNFCEWFYR